ncbi:MAG: 3-ketoacyl-ACP reductase [Solibacillus sp.]
MGQSLQGKVAVVTGAARGIGKAVAVAFAKEGVNVGIIARSEDALKQVAQEIESYGVKAAYAVADVSSLEQVQKAAATIKDALGGADILVNNAGVGKFAKLVDMDPADFKEILDVNVMGTFYVTHTILPQLIEKNAGDVINISSTNGLNGAATSSAYSASKFGVIGLTESLAAEVRRNNIRVTALAPSTIATDLADALNLVPDDKKEQYMHPEDIAEYIVAQLKLNQRMYIKAATLMNTNPF